MDGVLNHLRRGVRILGDLGVKTIILAADHGHLFGDEVGEDMKIEAPGGKTADLHRRVWVGSGRHVGAVVPADAADIPRGRERPGHRHALDLRLLQGEGRRRAYFHGGLSPQELIIPVVTLIPKNTGLANPSGTIDWKLVPGSRKLTHPVLLRADRRQGHGPVRA